MKQIKKKSYIILAALLLLLQLSISLPVYAADGSLTIAVSSSNISVGNTVTVTLRASGPGGAAAVSDMEFTYSTNVFSFVSCNAEGYTGGEGGTVKASGSAVNVVLKAVGQGKGSLKVTGTNGRLKDEAETPLSSMTAAGVVLNVAGNQSGDISLSGLTLSVGQLSPDFTGSVKEYTTTVPYETTSIEVQAQTSDSKASVESITGNADLQPGENTITITVKAENGSEAVYTIKATREAEAVQNPGDMDPEQTGQEGTADSQQPTADEWQFSRLQDEFQKLDKKYQEEKSFSRKVIAILIFIVIILVVICVNLLLSLKRKEDDADDFDFDKDDRKKERIGSSVADRDDSGIDNPDDYEAEYKEEPQEEDTAKADTPKDNYFYHNEWLDDEDDEDMVIIDLDKL